MNQGLAFANAMAEIYSRWSPHEAQAHIIHHLFYLKKRRLFLEWGRKGGKSETEYAILWLWALLFPGSSCYYIAPFMKQAKEIAWAPQRLQNFGPKHYLIGPPNNTELRINFANGSFIKLDGSENYEAYRGITPDIVIYDEFKDFRPEFHVAMEPNLAAKKAPLIVAGTAPETEDDKYFSLADEVAADLDGFHLRIPSWMNPHLDKEWLRKTKDMLYKRGEGHIWEREYGAKRVFGGPASIFPMYSDSMVHPHARLMEKIHKDRRKLQWYITADPGNMSVFAVLFTAVNPYTRDVYHLDELYITEQMLTSTSKVIPEIKTIRDGLFPDWEAMDDDPWCLTSDEAEAWFITEALSDFDLNFMPTRKSLHDKEEGLSLIKDQMLSEKVFISDRCQKTKWEVQNYTRDKNGKPPKKNDHLIDCWRYLNAAAGLNLTDIDEPAPKEPPKRLSDALREVQYDPMLPDYFQEDY